MRNAKAEFLEHTEGHLVIAAVIEYGYYMRDKKIVLRSGYTLDELNDFLDLLDFEYDSGYGSQELYGAVWFADGTWLERGEYDGSEWWEHKVCPPIPAEAA